MMRVARRLPLVVSALLLVAVVQKATHGRRRREPPPKPQPVTVPAGTLVTQHPRLLLDGEARARLKESARRGTPAWRTVHERCERDLKETQRSGYQGFDWADAMAELALCWHATGERRFADGAVRYFTALLDDREQVGDKQGGDGVVTHDDGYGMRSFGVFVALGYDWLHEVLPPPLRARVAPRLSAWIRWYREKGYQREMPIANYFCGYLAAETFAGLALSGEAPEAAGWLDHARQKLLGNLLLPEYKTKLDGGDWPEGWQYGELSAAEVALVVAGLRTATGVDLAPQVPWLAQIVGHHVHALQPGSRAVYDNGDWSEHPAMPSSVALTALPLALEPSRPEVAAQARWMTRHGLPDFGSERLWLPLLADRPSGVERDPHLGAPLSLLLPGTGVSFMRSEWTPGAVWVSFQAGPTIADHQHHDQGHFELSRAGDALLVDGGNYGSAATLNHNTLLVDDGGRHLNYSPNQGNWGRARTTRFFDDGQAVVAVGDIGEAWLPACVEDGCTARTVRSAVRTLVYLRPGVVVVADHLVVDEPGFAVTWAAHVTVQPELKRAVATAKIGGSRVDVQTLVPGGAHPTARREPTTKADGPYRQNEPWGPMWRIEVESPRGALERRFLHAVQAGAANETPREATSTYVPGGVGALLRAGGKEESVLVLDAPPEKPVPVDVSPTHVKALWAGLQPGARFRVTAQHPAKAGDPCVITLVPDPAGPLTANAGGFVHAPTPGCASR